MRGTLRTTTSSSVRSARARIGSAPFLFPAGTIVPDSGTPPSMTNFSMRGRRFGARTGPRPRRLARVTAMPHASFRARRPGPSSASGRESDSLRRHMLAVEAAMRAYARRFGEDEELWGAHRAAPRPRLRALPRPRDRPPAHTRSRELERARLSRRSSSRGVASHADFLGGPARDADGEDAVRRRRAVRLRARRAPTCAPTGIHGMTPKSVKKKLKQPSFAAAVDRDELRQGAEELGVDFDEHLAFVIAALEEHADELVPARDSA